MVERMGVVGAGVMGAEIAQAAAASGIAVRLVDADAAALERGVAHVGAICDRRVAKGRMTADEADEIRARVVATPSIEGLADCDLVVEAITEVLEPKRSVFRALDAVLAPDALLASNTSGLSIDALAAETGRPGQVVGMHFFNPASVMRLVEVVRAPRTSPETVAAIVAAARQMGKDPVVVRECPGFLVNRVLCRALAECYRATVELGADRAQVELAVASGGPAPMGPYGLGDLVGLDTLSHVISDLNAAYGDRFSDAATVGELVEQGRLGAKSGSGFDVPTDRAEADETAREVAARYYLGAFDEACRCLEEQVAQSAADIDLAMRLGCGWSAGPLEWADAEGLADIRERLATLAAAADRFAPRAPLADRLSAGARFGGEAG